ncbi:MAG: hypothetical protein D6679_05675 [Candidatus Hydrogenedentota bacterium]|nr:MAG: hypothetical protein D6679_05675 [Candidatus Hydrogenedentota bacterium]
MPWNYPSYSPPRGITGILRSFGPGAILASATIGAGETILAVRAGAWGGYDLLWLIFLACLTKSFFLLWFLGRYAALTGDNVAARLKEFPGPPGWLLVFILFADLVPAGPVFAAIASPCGKLIADILASSFPSLTGLLADPRTWGIAFALLAIGLAVIQKYDFLEKQQVFVCLVLLLAVILSTLLVHPSLKSIVVGLLSFGKVPNVPHWAAHAVHADRIGLELATVFGYAGNIAMGYIVYADFVREKRWGVYAATEPPPEPSALPMDEENLARARAGLIPLWGDLAVTSLLIFLVTGAFLIAGAAILNPRQMLPAGFDLLSKQATIFSTISPYLIPVYYVAILFALWGTLNSLPEIYARVTRDFLAVLAPERFRNLQLSTVMRILGAYFAVCVVVLIARGTKPMAMIHFVGLYSTNLGVAAAMAAALWLDRRLPRPLRSSPFFFVMGLLSFLVIAVFSGISAYHQWFVS